MKKIIYIIAIGLIGVMSSCDDDRKTPSIIQYSGDAEGIFTENRIAGISLYYEAAVKAGLDTRLSDDTERTFLVLNNAAMQAALQSGGFLTVASADVDFLTNLLDNHTLAGKTLAGDFTKSKVETLGDGELYVSVGESVVFNAQATVVGANNVVSNGVIHVIDFPVLKFPENSIATIIGDLAAADSLFTILNSALAATGLDATLGGGEFTVFAPTDAAFNAAGFADFAAVTAALSTEELTDLLRYHVLASRNLTNDLSSGRFYTMLGAEGEARGADITAESTDLSVDVAVETTSDAQTLNVLATNGVIHIMDAVLFAEPYLSTAINGSFGYDAGGNGLDGLVAGFYNTLSDGTLNIDSLLGTETEYTIAASRGFAAGADVKDALLGYIFEGNFSIADQAGTKIQALNGNYYWVTNDAGGNVIINGSSGLTRYTSGLALVEDGEAYNGVWSMYNAGWVAVPEVSTATQLEVELGVDSAADYSLMSAGLRFFNLDSLDNSTYLYVENQLLASTYFDAIDEADNDVDIAGIASNDYDSLISLLDVLDAGILTTVLNRHVVNEVAFGSDLDAGDSYTNLNSESLEVVSVGADFGFLVNDGGDVSTITFAGFNAAIASNGVVHILNDIIPEP